MIPILSFDDIPSLTHLNAVVIRQWGTCFTWGTLYQKTYGSNWVFEHRLSSTESQVVNMGTEEKWRAELYARELIWGLIQRGLLNPPPQPSSRGDNFRQPHHRPTPPQAPAVPHPAHTTRDENAPAVDTQLPTSFLHRVLRALLPSRQ